MTRRSAKKQSHQCRYMYVHVYNNYTCTYYNSWLCFDNNTYMSGAILEKLLGGAQANETTPLYIYYACADCNKVQSSCVQGACALHNIIILIYILMNMSMAASKLALIMVIHREKCKPSHVWCCS